MRGDDVFKENAGIQTWEIAWRTASVVVCIWIMWKLSKGSDMKTLAVTLCCLSSVSWGQVSGRPIYSTQVRTALEAYQSTVSGIAEEMGRKYVDATNDLVHISAQARSIARDVTDPTMQARFEHMILDPTLSQQVNGAANDVRADIGDQVVRRDIQRVIGQLIPAGILAQVDVSDPWEDFLNQFRQRLRDDIDVMEAESIEAYETLFSIHEQAILRQDLLRRIVGQQDAGSERALLQRMRLPEALRSDLERRRKELDTDLSK